MCISSLMIDNDIIKCVIEDLLDRICLINSSPPIPIPPPTYYSSKSIENKFNQSISILNNSLKQLLTYELTTVVNNGQLSTTSNVRHGRYYNPATAIKQLNDLKRRLHWVQQRQMILKEFNLNGEKTLNESNPDVNSIENIWFERRLKMLDSSLERLRQQEQHDEQKQEEEIRDDQSCARCRIYQRKNDTDSQLLKRLKQVHQVHNEHNYSKPRVQNSTPESDLILSLSKIADRIGYSSFSIVSNTSKKLPSTPLPPPPPPPPLLPSTTTTTTGTIKKKQQQQIPSKLQPSVSLTAGDTSKNSKRTIDESRTISNSSFISNNYELTNKRHKRIASPQSAPSVSATNVPGTTTTNASSHEILTPSWRLLTTIDFDSLVNSEKISEQQETEDISDESYIHRHIRCEAEQESWTTNSSISKNVSLTSNRKSGTLQASLSVPNGLSTPTTTQKQQYRCRLAPNGIAYTETIDTK